MNKIDYLIDCIKREIPKELLEFTFCPPTLLGTVSYNLDYMIRSEIIEGWLLRDLDVMGGREVTIPISSGCIRTAKNGYIITIPQSATGGRAITSVLSVAYGVQDSAFNQVGNEMVDALSPMVRSTDARVQLVGPMTVFVEGDVMGSDLYLRCVLNNDSDLGNIDTRAMLVLADMAIQACKGFIWTNRIIRVDTAAVVAGAEIGKYAEIIEGYLDAHEIYKEMRRLKWMKVRLMQDRATHNRMLRSMMPR